VRNVAYLDRKSLELKEDEDAGVLVDAVIGGGWAALGRLAVGDMIRRIDGKPMREVQDVEAIMAEIKKERRGRVIFEVKRGIHNRFIELEPVWRELEKANVEVKEEGAAPER
jgi:C-terminal processing protease CtpA/Prc